MNPSPSHSRLAVVDALRGFAIVSIMLLHNIEHFDFWYAAEGIPEWMQPIDKFLWNGLFFLFGGKSYAIFALLFGLTFFIQSSRQAQQGHAFGLRFAWRLLLLLGFGCINTTFFQGDILSIYAVLGFFLIPFERLSSRWVLAVSIVLLLQPMGLYQLAQALMHPGQTGTDPRSWHYFGQMAPYITEGSLWEVMRGNLTNGKAGVLLWSWENGRYFHILALFLLGMLIGRKQLFQDTPVHARFWRWTLASACLAFAILYPIQLNINTLFASKLLQESVRMLVSSWANLSFMVILLASFTLVFRTSIGYSMLKRLSPIGKMSLSNYVIQSILGSSIYYGFGLGLYRYTGATYGTLIGIVLAIGMGVFCTFWMRHFRHGPLEYLWHKATWVGSDRSRTRKITPEASQAHTPSVS